MARLPEQVRWPKELQEQRLKVDMVGDGVNDAPAPMQVDFAIDGCTDVSIECTDVVLMKSDPHNVAGTMTLSRATLRKMHQNLWWEAGYNLVALPLAAGVLYPLLLSCEIAAFAMSRSSAFITNALRINRRKLDGIGPTSGTASGRLDADENATGVLA